MNYYMFLWGAFTLVWFIVWLFATNPTKEKKGFNGMFAACTYIAVIVVLVGFTVTILN